MRPEKLKILLCLVVLAGALLAAAGPAAAAQSCSSDADCNDGLFCNGQEICGLKGKCEAAQLPACDPGHQCNEKSDRCVGPLERAALWSQLWGDPVGESTAIEVLGFDPDQIRPESFEVKALDDLIEVGEGVFIPLAGTPALLAHQVAPEELDSDAEVFVHYVAGRLFNAEGREIATDGLLVTGKVDGTLSSFFSVFEWGGELEPIRGRKEAILRAIASLSVLGNGGPTLHSVLGNGSPTLQAKGSVPPAYGDGACFEGHDDGYPGFSACGKTYCNCVWDETAEQVSEEGECLLSLASFVTCLAAGGGPLCLIGIPLNCLYLVLELGESQAQLEACRAQADQCFCNYDPNQYEQYCSDQLPIRFFATKLRPGEEIDIITRCSEPGNPSNETFHTVSLREDQRSGMSPCDPTWNAHVFPSSAGVKTPNVLSIHRVLSASVREGKKTPAAPPAALRLRGRGGASAACSPGASSAARAK